MVTVSDTNILRPMPGKKGCLSDNKVSVVSETNKTIHSTGINN
jgi:hypothetical protein